VLLILVVNRLLSPGSAWRLHREWYGRSALPDLLGMASVIDEHALYDCHDLLLGHKTARFDHLADRWRDLFNISFDVLLYDLTSTYFEIDPPLSDEDKRQFGCCRTVGSQRQLTPPPRSTPRIRLQDGMPRRLPPESAKSG